MGLCHYARHGSALLSRISADAYIVYIVQSVNPLKQKEGAGGLSRRIFVRDPSIYRTFRIDHPLIPAVVAARNRRQGKSDMDSCLSVLRVEQAHAPAQKEHDGPALMNGHRLIDQDVRFRHAQALPGDVYVGHPIGFVTPEDA
jgi:hypothetical protein